MLRFPLLMLLLAIVGGVIGLVRSVLPRAALPPTENVALNKPATMVSAAANTTAAMGVDGNTDGDANWFMTEWNNKPWWMVDLQRDYTIYKFEIFNRTDGGRVGGAETLTIALSVDGKNWRGVYAHDKSAFGAQKGDRQLKLQIAPTTARYARIQLTNPGYLHLSEVRVYGN